MTIAWKLIPRHALFWALIVLGFNVGLRGAVGTEPPTIMTVRGPIPAAQLGLTLSHEHIMSIFGAEPTLSPRYDEPAVMASVVPTLRGLRERGLRAVFDGTAEYFGRSPLLLRKISEASDLHLITNTGYYGAAKGRYLPSDLATVTVEQISERWTHEWQKGIGDTSIRPGFIKLGVEAGPLNESNRKLVEAAALTHLQTGLSIAVHTGANAEAAGEQLTILEKAGVPPSAWIWIHAHQVNDPAVLVTFARRGAWISLDSWSAVLAAKNLEALRQLKAAGLLHRVLLSHDGNLFPAPGAKPRPIDWLLREGRTVLAAAGLTDDEWLQLTTRNPATAYAVGVKRQAATRAP